MVQGETTVEVPTRPLALVAIVLTGVLASATLGAATNAINGFMSPRYFVTVMGWQGVENVWRASIAQGMFEGLCVGMLFSLIFAVGAGIITLANCTYNFALRHVLGIVSGAFVGWVLGGIAAMIFATISPELYQHAFAGVPREFGAKLAHAWVRGSIWGVESGGLVSVIVGLVVLRANWRREVRLRPFAELGDVPGSNLFAGTKDIHAIKNRDVS